MDRQLESPLLLHPLSSPKSLSASSTYAHISSFLPSLPLGPSRTQLERLADSLGVDTGNLAPSESDRREAARAEAKLAEKNERRRKREERLLMKEEEERRRLEGMVDDYQEDDLNEGQKLREGGEGKNDEDEDMELGHQDGEKVEEKGDVEYDDGDEEDEDEPDNEHREKMSDD
ncbi:hypothetical protein M231_01265 [Tremella mesenterica]|uniref:Uncharacterized protein n=1 Tax=Tremella mesenterica TaxID=5217 RepID=A0A4Q1BTN9_TREME|nr:hypothetical protein M231_01265 [Tremella mesenterica]